MPGPIRVDWYGRDCAIDLPTVLVDGTTRDRCPPVGDEAVINRTLDASSPNWGAQRAMLAWFASAQHADGSIPASPLAGGSVVLFDYNAYWLDRTRRLRPLLRRSSSWRVRCGRTSCS